MVFSPDSVHQESLEQSKEEREESTPVAKAQEAQSTLIPPSKDTEPGRHEEPSLLPDTKPQQPSSPSP